MSSPPSAKLSFPEDFQNTILNLVIHSTSFMKLVRARLRAEHFAAREQWILCQLAYRFYDRYHTSPGAAMAQELSKYIVRAQVKPDDATLLRRLLSRQVRPTTVPVEYAKNEIDKFLQHEQIRTTLEQFMPKYNLGDYDLNALTRELSNILRAERPVEKDGNLLQNYVPRAAARARLSGLPLATLIPELDETMEGILPGQLGTVMAPSGIGKSYMLVHLGKAAAMQGATVLHYTLEMTREEIETRYDQMIAGLTRGRLIRQHGALRLLSRNARLLASRGGRIYVRYKPFGYTVSDLRSDIENDLELVHADAQRRLVIVDYGEVLAVERRARHEDLRTVWQELKSIATDLSMSVWVATQSNRGAIGAEKISGLDVAESYDKVRISDIFLGFNRNMVYNRRTHQWNEIDIDNNFDTVRLFVIKHRNRRDTYSVRFRCDFERGQFYVRDDGGAITPRVGIAD